jgi:hypothetical protein
VIGLQEMCAVCKKQVLVIDETISIIPSNLYVKKVFGCGHEYESAKNLKSRLFETFKNINSELQPWVLLVREILDFFRQ